MDVFIQEKIMQYPLTSPRFHYSLSLKIFFPSSHQWMNPFLFSGLYRYSSLNLQI